MKKMDSLQVRAISAAFSVFDRDGDGFISRSELVDVMKALGHMLSTEQIMRMLEAGDEDGDGVVNPTEFAALLGYEGEMPSSFSSFSGSVSSGTGSATTSVRHRARAYCVCVLCIFFGGGEGRTAVCALCDRRCHPLPPFLLWIVRLRLFTPPTIPTQMFLIPRRTFRRC